VSLAHFIGSELITALGRLGPGHVLGPWRGNRPAQRRRRMKFAPVLYGEDHAHGHAELCLLIEGRCRFSFHHEGCVLQPGDLVFCAANTPHAEAYVRRGDGYRLVWWSLSETQPRFPAPPVARPGRLARGALLGPRPDAPDRRARPAGG